MNMELTSFKAFWFLIVFTGVSIFGYMVLSVVKRCRWNGRRERYGKLMLEIHSDARLCLELLMQFLSTYPQLSTEIDPVKKSLYAILWSYRDGDLCSRVMSCPATWIAQKIIAMTGSYTDTFAYKLFYEDDTGLPPTLQSIHGLLNRIYENAQRAESIEERVNENPNELSLWLGRNERELLAKRGV